MSFSSEIKEKLCSVSAECDNDTLAEVAGILRGSGAINQGVLRLTVSGEATAMRLAENIRDIFCDELCISHKGNSYITELSDAQSLERIEKAINTISLLKDECCINAFLRGVFLAGGSISDPEKSWHLEFDTHYKDEALIIEKLLEQRDIHCGVTERKGKHIVYIKDCDSIAAVLGRMGAGADALQLFGIQVERKMRNDINRRVNFENANLNKSVKAAYKSIEAVKLLKESGEWSGLPDVLKEIGELRVENLEMSLKQLGEMLDPPIGKSGVNHRLNRLIEAAENIGNNTEQDE